MDNRKIFLIAVILLIIAALAFGGYYFYQRYGTLNDQLGEKAPETNGFSLLPAGEETGDEADNACGQIHSIIVDGTFEKIEDGLLYLQPKETSAQINIVRLTAETEFFKMNLSREMQVLDQTEITPDEFKAGNNISVVAVCDSDSPDEMIAQLVKKVAVEPESEPTEGEPAETE